MSSLVSNTGVLITNSFQHSSEQDKAHSQRQKHYLNSSREFCDRPSICSFYTTAGKCEGQVIIALTSFSNHHKSQQNSSFLVSLFCRYPAYLSSCQGKAYSLMIPLFPGKHIIQSQSNNVKPTLILERQAYVTMLLTRTNKNTNHLWFPFRNMKAYHVPVLRAVI